MAEEYEAALDNMCISPGYTKTIFTIHLGLMDENLGRQAKSTASHLQLLQWADLNQEETV